MIRRFVVFAARTWRFGAADGGGTLRLRGCRCHDRCCQSGFRGLRLRAALAAFRTTTFTAWATLTARFAITSAFAGLIVAAAARLFGIGFAIAGAVARLA